MSHLSIPLLYWATGPRQQSAGRGTLRRWENTENHSTLQGGGKKEESCISPFINSVEHEHHISVQLNNPTCRAEQEDGRFTQEPIDLVGYRDLSMGE